MRFFAAIVLIAAVASAEPSSHPSPSAIIGHILEALGSLKPQPGPAVIDGEPISVGPAIIDSGDSISVGPAIVDFPIPDGGDVSESVVAPSPVSVVEGPAVAPSPVSVVEGPVVDVAGSSPLVQIIVNVNKASPAVPEVVPVSPVVRPEPIVRPEPVGEIPAEPVQVVEVAPEPVQVVEVAPVQVEPVQIGVPIIPEAAVVLPEQLN